MFLLKYIEVKEDEKEVFRKRVLQWLFIVNCGQNKIYKSPKDLEVLF